MTQNREDKFSPEETRKRMEAALRGARVAGHKALGEIAPKQASSKKSRPAPAGKALNRKNRKRSNPPA